MPGALVPSNEAYQIVRKAGYSIGLDTFYRCLRDEVKCKELFPFCTTIKCRKQYRYLIPRGKLEQWAKEMGVMLD